MNEFVWYHINGDGDCNGQVLREYARAERLGLQDCFDLAYFYATTYCCVSAVFLFQNRREIRQDCIGFAREHKKDLIFQSDRKYVKMLDNFEKMLKYWRANLQTSADHFRAAVATQNPGVINTAKAIEKVESWYFFKRFSAYLFVETYCDILSLKATRVSGLEYEGDSMTFAGGACYVFGKDIEAQYIQKNHKLPFSTGLFEEMIHSIQQQVLKAGGDDSLVKLETSLCAYEKFFKGTRYNGFYADRMLAEIESMKSNPKFAAACDAVLSARARAINEIYLGERHGWHGIRKELKKSYQQTNRITGYRG